MKYDNYNNLENDFYKMIECNDIEVNKAFRYFSDKTNKDNMDKLKDSYNKKHGGLKNYLSYGFGLYPLTNDGRPLVKIYDNEHKLIENNMIKNENQIKYCYSKNVKRFSFIPSNNNMICIDLDNSVCHANNTNGIKNFIDIINNSDLSRSTKDLFIDFPNNFPCYVETPHNGYHLYFFDSYLTDNIKKGFDKSRFNGLNIEIKDNTQITIGGSIRDGKEYILHGDLADAPVMPLELARVFQKPRVTPSFGTMYFNSFANKNTNKWNSTPESIMNKAIELYNMDSPHTFAYKTAVLFKNSGFNKDIAVNYITNSTIHCGRVNKNDTLSAISSIY